MVSTTNERAPVANKEDDLLATTRRYSHEPYDEKNDDQTLRELDDRLDPYLVREHVLPFFAVFGTESRMRRVVLPELTRSPPLLSRQFVLTCPNLRKGFTEYDDVEYEYADRLPALITMEEEEEEGLAAEAVVNRDLSNGGFFRPCSPLSSSSSSSS